jgi:hypothetical protein
MRFRVCFLAIFLLPPHVLAAPNPLPAKPSTTHDDPSLIVASLTARSKPNTCKKNGEECTTQEECCVRSLPFRLFPRSLDELVHVYVKHSVSNLLVDRLVAACLRHRAVCSAHRIWENVALKSGHAFQSEDVVWVMTGAS